MVTIPQLIAAVCPDRYYDGNSSQKAEFKRLIKEKGVYEAAKKAKVKSDASHKLIYDSPTETLEPVYFFILDLMNEFNLSVDKLADNFVSSPGSQHFGDMGQRISIMQQQGAKLLGDINTVMKSVLNIIYDLREFKIRLSSYEDLNNPAKKASALLSLKQIWMDKVDIQKGNSSIKAMALGQGGFNTLIDAFLVVNSDKEIEGLDLNQIVKRILRPRLHDFQNWLKESEGELRKRYDLEKTYLKSQVSSLRLYAKWAKPYLKAAHDLEMSERERSPALVKMFNSIVLELTLFGKKSLDIKSEAQSGNFPSFFATDKFLNSVNETYNACVLIDFNFRGIPSKTQQGFVVGGMAEVTFMGYSLKGSEIDKLYKALDEAEVNDALSLINGATEESIGALEEDIKFFLEEDKKEEKEEKANYGTNPFLALAGIYNKKDKKKKKEKSKKNPKVSANMKWYEQEYFFPAMGETSSFTAFKLFDVYKKTHGMAAFPDTVS